MSNCGIYPTVGVTVRRNDYPLVKASCEILVIDVNTLSKLSQTFVSTSAYAQDVNYVFPLPSDAAVCAFTAIIDGEHTIKGTVKERQEAQSAFNEARRAGKTAALVKQHTSQVFEVSLGNIKPRQSITVRLDLISVIAHAGINDCLRLRIPTSVARFYGAPPASLKGHSEGEIISFDFTATFQMTGNITSIRSDTHPVTCTIGALLVNPEERLNPTQAHVELHMIELLREDIVLEVRSNGLDSPRCFVQRWSPPGHGMTTDALSLTLVPRFKATPITSQDYVFLVDRSASMAGGRIRAVRDALHIMIRSLPSTGTTFNIFSFGTLCDSLWPTSQQYDQDRVTTAATHIDSMEADYGRTNIASAMQKVLEARRAAQAGVNVPTAVFVLTDGNAWDLQPVFRNVVRVVKHSHNATRVFVLGVGNQVSSEMCDGIARAGRGIATYVGEQENLGAKLVNLLKAARNFAVDDVSIDWGAPLDIEDDFVIVEPSHSGTTTPAGTIAPTSGSRAGLSLSDPSADLKEVIELDPTSQIPSLPPPPTVQQAPSRQDRLPPLYPGSRASIFALIKTDRAAPLPKTVHVRGTMSGSPVTLEVPVTAAPSELIPEDTHAPFFHSLAARALIQDIEDSAAASSLTSIATAQIARLGIEYSLASSQTSFIAVDNQSTDVVSPVAVSDKAETSPTVQRRGPARRRKRHLLCANPVSSESDGEESTVVVSDPRLIFNSPSIKNENSNSSQSPPSPLKMARIVRVHNMPNPASATPLSISTNVSSLSPITPSINSRRNLPTPPHAQVPPPPMRPHARSAITPASAASGYSQQWSALRSSISMAPSLPRMFNTFASPLTSAVSSSPSILPPALQDLNRGFSPLVAVPPLNYNVEHFDRASLSNKSSCEDEDYDDSTFVVGSSNKTARLASSNPEVQSSVHAGAPDLALFKVGTGLPTSPSAQVLPPPQRHRVFSADNETESPETTQLNFAISPAADDISHSDSEVAKLQQSARKSQSSAEERSSAGTVSPFYGGFPVVTSSPPINSPGRESQNFPVATSWLFSTKQLTPLEDPVNLKELGTTSYPTGNSDELRTRDVTENKRGMAVGPREAASPLTVASIARTQQFDGGFPADSSFPIDHLQLQKIPATPAALVGAGDVLMALWHTILALVVLKKRFSTTDERESWELIDEKAREWAMEKIDNVLDVGNREEAAMLLAKWLEIAESGI